MGTIVELTATAAEDGNLKNGCSVVGSSNPHKLPWTKPKQSQLNLNQKQNIN